MKSPKDNLLHQHADAVPALDKIREQVVADLPKPPRHRMTLASFFAEAWAQLFWQSRQVWGSLAAVWIVIFVVNSAASRTEVPVTLATVDPVKETPVWVKHHNVLRAELGLPPQQHAKKSKSAKPSAIRQESRHQRPHAIA